MDGLRGFLALAVSLHHAAIYPLFLRQTIRNSDAWLPPPSRFFENLGPAGVSMFFMITGYLFWSRLIAEHGRLAWRKLYIGRIFRIGPLYLVARGVAALFDHLSRTPVPPTSTLNQVASWAIGLFLYKDWHKFLAGVTWTIQEEWLFYLSLPFLAIFVARSRRHLALSLLLLSAPLVVVATNFHHAAQTSLRIHLVRGALFYAGMVCGSLHRAGIRAAMPDWTASCLVALSAGSVLLFPDVYMPGPLILLAVAFFLIVSGCSFWGLLTSRPAIRLGDISYGIYLMQGLVLAAVFRPGPLRYFALSSPWHYWSLTLAALLLLVLTSMATYVWIERPGIALGRRLALSLRD